VYTAAAERERTRQQLAGNLLERAFAGSARDLVLGALGAKRVSAEELEEIRGVLDRFARERGRTEGER
jgi:predicted transcriptional regulator